MARVYYYGLRKWDNYLLDIDQDIQAAGESTQRLASETRGLHDAVRGGFEGLRSGIEGLQTGIEDLRADFQWGFSLLADRLDTQISIMSGIAKQLDAINAALDAPLDKQARELFRIGLVRLRDGLDDKALESFLQSEEKNDVDFVLQLYIGKLYLYGKGVRNLRKATDHLLLAARYAEAKKGRIEGWNHHAAEAYFHAAIATYLEGEGMLGDGKQQGSSAPLEVSLEFLAKAEPLWPQFLEITYTRAKCSALLGKWEGVRQSFQFLSDRDRRYFLKASEDRDFDECRDLLKEVADRALANPGPLAREIAGKIETASEALSWARRPAAQDTSILEMVEIVSRRIDAAKRDVSTLDVDLVALNTSLGQDIHSLANAASNGLNSQLSSAEEKLGNCDNVRNAQKDEIEKLKRSISEQSGCGMGCLYAILSLFIFSVCGGLFFSVFAPGIFSSRAAGNYVSRFGAAFLVIGGLIGTATETKRKKAPFQESIMNATAIIAECDSSRPSLESDVAMVSKELEAYKAWLRKNHDVQISNKLTSDKPTQGDRTLETRPW